MRIAKLRMEMGMTQQQMADKLNISLAHCRSLETGRRGCSIDLLVEIAFVFDISLDYLILGRLKHSDSKQFQDALGDVIGQLERLKANMY